jgi:hypothetical protein
VNFSTEIDAACIPAAAGQHLHNKNVGNGGKGEGVAAWLIFSCYLFLAYQLLKPAA